MVIIDRCSPAWAFQRKLRFKLTNGEALIVITWIARISTNNRIMSNILQQFITCIERQSQHEWSFLSIHPIIASCTSCFKRQSIGRDKPTIRLYASGYIFWELDPRILIFTTFRPMERLRVIIRLRLRNRNGTFRNRTSNEHRCIPFGFFISSIQVFGFLSFLVKLQDLHPQLAIIINELIFTHIYGCRRINMLHDIAVGCILGSL
ncbi:hypothetical protein D3C78_1073820 [compost metagenome]